MHFVLLTRVNLMSMYFSLGTCKRIKKPMKSLLKRHAHVPIAKQFLIEMETRTNFNEQKLIYFYFHFHFLSLSSTELRFINIGLECESREFC